MGLERLTPGVRFLRTSMTVNPSSMLSKLQNERPKDKMAGASGPHRPSTGPLVPHGSSMVPAIAQSQGGARQSQHGDIGLFGLGS